jgi:Ca-activated chloride channel homolog
MSSRTRTILIGLLAGIVFAVVPRGVLTQSATPQAAQSGSATLSGVVTEKSGGLVPGATVVLTNLATGEKLPPRVTNAAGAYAFPGLAPGQYKVTITLQGFKTAEIAVTLAAGSTNALSTKLEIGQVSEVVNVTAGTELVRTDTPTVTQTVSANFIQTLPRSDRDALNSLVFLPGVTTVGGASGAHVNTSIAGLPAKQFSITIDGISQVTLPTGETYSGFEPNRFKTTVDHPLSTFGADVDTASYSNVRRFLSSGQLPPGEAIRIEELVNYFRFGYAAPRDGRPIALTTEIGDCPWAPSHKLVLIGARAAAPPAREITGRNIVLLVDVSGSMAGPERLPLIKTALGLFVDTLKPDDSLAIVTYAGTSGVALPPTPARRRDDIQRAIGELNAGGSTNGGQGLILAYRIAREAFIPGGVNRVILATDGDFNVGIVDQRDLLQLIEHERESGVFLSVFGVGSGNLKDATMEMLADRGNGHYAYLDSLQEARRVLIREGDATLETVAKDVKFQVEFNPAVVSAWKLLGYEDRALRAQDFNNDRKDAGEMGAGHTVTVLYEVVPVGADTGEDRPGGRPEVDPLKYQAQTRAVQPARPAPAAASGEWLTVKARYKLPESDTSDLIAQAVKPGPLQHLPLAAAVAEFGLLLRDDPRDTKRWDALVRRLDRLSVPVPLMADVDGLRELVATAAGLARLR